MANQYDKYICFVGLVYEEEGEDVVERIKTLAKKLPFKCKRCGDNIYYCFLETLGTDQLDREWLNRPFFGGGTVERIEDYVNVRHPLVCLSELCYGKYGYPVVVFNIEKFVEC